jgi:hypothetical protein
MSFDARERKEILVTEQQNLKPVSNICVGSGGKSPTPTKLKSINIVLLLLLLFLLSFAPVLLLYLLPETKKTIAFARIRNKAGPKYLSQTMVCHDRVTAVMIVFPHTGFCS